MKRFFVLADIAIVLLSQLGCSSDEEQTELENPAAIEETSAFSGAPLLGDVVLENMYEDEARQLTDKTPVQIVTVIEGTNRVVLDAQFRGVRDFGFGFPLYEFELTDALAEEMGGIAQGMSGSPVGPPGRIMGHSLMVMPLREHRVASGRHPLMRWKTQLPTKHLERCLRRNVPRLHLVVSKQHIRR